MNYRVGVSIDPASKFHQEIIFGGLAHTADTCMLFFQHQPQLMQKKHIVDLAQPVSLLSWELPGWVPLDDPHLVSLEDGTQGPHIPTWVKLPLLQQCFSSQLPPPRVLLDQSVQMEIGRAMLRSIISRAILSDYATSNMGSGRPESHFFHECGIHEPMIRTARFCLKA